MKEDGEGEAVVSADFAIHVKREEKDRALIKIAHVGLHPRPIRSSQPHRGLRTRRLGRSPSPHIDHPQRLLFLERVRPARSSTGPRAAGAPNAYTCSPRMHNSLAAVLSRSSFSPIRPNFEGRRAQSQIPRPQGRIDWNEGSERRLAIASTLSTTKPRGAASPELDEGQRMRTRQGDGWLGGERAYARLGSREKERSASVQRWHQRTTLYGRASRHTSGIPTSSATR
ncbi:hypothetical protein C8R45DRAFT_923767 [Mycena sanguinolenta]|nr:hypothetical protein C8R45DRAFT_923767 [Mycena sanguinolenta]